MWANSKYRIKIDFDRSYGSYIVDMENNKYLDFFSQYSTIPLGYNHPIFSTNDFQKDAMRIAKCKIVNCEIITEVAEKFLKDWKKWPGKNYNNFHFACTGGLAVEAAIKVAIEQKNIKRPIILTHKGNFHGITGLGMMVTDRFPPINTHINENVVRYFPRAKLVRPYREEDLNSYQDALQHVGKIFKNNLAGMIVEPIQCTFGDYFSPKDFFAMNREFCDKYDIPLIHDEIQTGFGATGKMWYSDIVKCKPDILIFGKKSQVSGIMTNLPIDYKTQEVSWDGNLIDMLRCIYIMKAMKQDKLLRNIDKEGRLFGTLLKMKAEENPNIVEHRGLGGIHALQFINKKTRDTFSQRTFDMKLLSNPTKDTIVRFRLNLAVRRSEIEKAIRIIAHAIK